MGNLCTAFYFFGKIVEISGIKVVENLYERHYAM